MKGLTLMSWLRNLNHIYRDSPHVCSSRVCSHESSECSVSFAAMHPDAVILHFESLVDDRLIVADQGLRSKCDLIALQGTDHCVEIVLVEVKAGVSASQRTIRATFRKARSQLADSAVIVREEIADCAIRLPNRLIGHAVVVVKGADQETIARHTLANVSAEFRRQTGFRLQIASCGDDIAHRIGIGAS